MFTSFSVVVVECTSMDEFTVALISTGESAMSSTWVNRSKPRRKNFERFCDQTNNVQDFVQNYV